MKGFTKQVTKYRGWDKKGKDKQTFYHYAKPLNIISFAFVK